MQIPGLYITSIPDKGRGVFTSIDIEEGSTIEVCPILLIPSHEVPIIHKTVLHDYYFLWGEDHKECVIALGFGSIYNHDVHSNADFILDYYNETIDIVALRNIKAHEEITINYNGTYGDNSPLWFDK